MKKTSMGLILGMLSLGLSACGTTTSGPSPVSISGTWDGNETYPAQNGLDVQSFKVRYVINDNNGALTGQFYSCANSGFDCQPKTFTGNRSGNTINLFSNTVLINDDKTPIIITTQATLNGSVISGSSSYPGTSLTFNGTVVLTKQ